LSGQRFTFFASLDARLGYGLARPKVARGRMPRPDQPDEVLLDERSVSSEKLHVGSDLPVVVFSEDEARAFQGGEGPPPPGTSVRLHVVGIGVSPSDVPVAESDRFTPSWLSPAFLRTYRPGRIYQASMVRLRRGDDDVAAFVEAAQRVSGDEQVFYQTRPELENKARRAVRPYWGALTLFAVVGAAAALIILGQALIRQRSLDTSDYPVLAALGMSRGQLVTGALVRLATLGLAAAAVAVSVAVALSPLTPIGMAREAEARVGFSADGLALGLGALAVAVLPMLVTVLPTWRAARAGMCAGADGEARPRSRVADAVCSAGLGPSAATGVCMALAPGRGRTAVPVRLRTE